MGTKKPRLIFPTQSPDRLGPSLQGPVGPNEGSNEIGAVGSETYILRIPSPLFTEWENKLPLERSCTMSPAVGNFVQDLVEMAKATETLPIVQHENETLKADLSQAQDTIAARETAIISYKQQIEDLHAKVRSLEVERDDASFRVLEAEDTAHSILTQARNAQATLAEVISKLDPPKPQPEPEPFPQAAPSEPQPALPQAV